MLPEKIAFVDVETTGTSFTKDRIIEIGIVRVENSKVVKKYSTLVNPFTYVSPYILQMTGIEEKELENAPTFWEIKDEVQNILSDCVFISHNVRFDYGFVKGEFSKIESNFSAKEKCCSVKLSKTLFPQYPRHGLDSIIERFGIKCKNRHRALDDALVIWEFFKILKKTIPEDTLKSAFKSVQRRPSSPNNLSNDILTSLPETPGVYIFYDKNEMPLYVGKSINIKDRVLSHFCQNELVSDFKICRDTERVETIETAGELGALILESNLVKKLSPIYNKKLRRNQEMHVLIKSNNDNGYITASYASVKSLDKDDLANVLAIYKSKKEMTESLREMAKKYSLCLKLLGVEKSHGACFGTQLETCNGACIGKEKQLKYNLRCEEAFSQTQIIRWPFNGPILLKEKNENKEELFIIDKWCYMNYTNKYYEEISTKNLIFDTDTYKILKSYLLKNHKRVTISPLGLIDEEDSVLLNE